MRAKKLHKIMDKLPMPDRKKITFNRNAHSPNVGLYKNKRMIRFIYKNEDKVRQILEDRGYYLKRLESDSRWYKVRGYSIIVKSRLDEVREETRG